MQATRHGPNWLLSPLLSARLHSRLGKFRFVAVTDQKFMQNIPRPTHVVFLQVGDVLHTIGDVYVKGMSGYCPTPPVLPLSCSHSRRSNSLRSVITVSRTLTGVCLLPGDPRSLPSFSAPQGVRFAWLSSGPCLTGASGQISSPYYGQFLGADTGTSCRRMVYVDLARTWTHVGTAPPASQPVLLRQYGAI